MLFALLESYEGFHGIIGEHTSFCGRLSGPNPAQIRIIGNIQGYVRAVIIKA